MGESKLLVKCDRCGEQGPRRAKAGAQGWLKVHETHLTTGQERTVWHCPECLSKRPDDAMPEDEGRRWLLGSLGVEFLPRKTKPMLDTIAKGMPPESAARIRRLLAPLVRDLAAVYEATNVMCSNVFAQPDQPEGFAVHFNAATHDAMRILSELRPYIARRIREITQVEMLGGVYPNELAEDVENMLASMIGAGSEREIAWLLDRGPEPSRFEAWKN